MYQLFPLILSVHLLKIRGIFSIDSHSKLMYFGEIFLNQLGFHYGNVRKVLLKTKKLDVFGKNYVFKQRHVVKIIKYSIKTNVHVKCIAALIKR